jgi:hypothetical protein
MEEMMKILNSAILALTLGVASVTSAQAHDSFSFGLNIGGYPPPVTFYSPPVVYYSSTPYYYSPQPVVTYQYENEGRPYCRRNWGHEEHEEHEGEGRWGQRGGGHRGWGHGGDHDDWH